MEIKNRGKCIYKLQSCREALLERSKELEKNKLIRQPENHEDNQIKHLIDKTIQRGHQQSSPIIQIKLMTLLRFLLLNK